MNLLDKNIYMYYLTLSLILCTLISAHTNQIEDNQRISKHKITWCTVNQNETKKCEAFSQANERDRIKVGYETVKIECIEGSNKDDCMELLDSEKATMTTLDAGEIIVGGRFHSLVPIAQEILTGGYNYYYAVAVVKRNSLPDVISLRDLKGKRACFAGVETYAGWILPISTLINEGVIDVIDCNNHVKTATNFFGPSCAANCLTDKYNPIGDNSAKLCQLCVGEIPGRWCNHADPYAGYDGALRCLLNAGEIAFLKHTTILDLLATREFSGIQDHVELFCKDGSRRPLSEYLECNWGKVPSNAIVVSSVVPYETREIYQNFLQKFGEIYSKDGRKYMGNNYNDHQEYDNHGDRIDSNRNQFDDYGNRPNSDINQYNRHRDYDQYNSVGNKRFRRQQSNYGYDYDQDLDRTSPHNQNRFNTESSRFDNINDDRNNNYPLYEYFNLFESARYGDHGNLMFQDSTIGIAKIPENLQIFETFLSELRDVINGIRNCPVERMTLCVTSEAENDKCVKMKIALKAQLLKPEMECFRGHSQIHCMQAINAGVADVTVLDGSDVYTAGINFDLVPFISEVYNLDDADYYVVAVAKESDPDTDLTYLRTKNTCHGGINMAAGWVYPLAFLISNGWIRPYGCNSVRAAAEYFSKMCVPGAMSAEYNVGVPYDNMCDLCHGASYRYCRRDASEDYYGHTGAFRCLVEGGGHVAFVKHTTVFENTGGKKREWWVRDNLVDDFELLCPDGTRAEVNDYRKCNLGKVKANAIVTRGGAFYNETSINAYINLFMYAQTFYGKKTTDEFSFSMFTSEPPYADLIFQDATTQLKIIPPSKRYYSAYLGPDFMRARRVVDCHAGGNRMRIATYILVISFVPIVILH